jgi:glyoxylase-like metal-dependent hydrolase (beta-lactamase superfamily II)
MLKISHYESVTRFELGRSFAGRSIYWTTAYQVDGLLVDSGCAYSARELERALAQERIQCILNTHTHEDHIGANGLLQRSRIGLGIFAHPLALPVLLEPHEKQPLQLYRRVLWGWPEVSHGQALEEGTVIKTEKHAFQVIYTPGHSHDHICLYEPRQGWLFSGDLFVGGRDRALRADCDIWGIIASLKKIAALPASWLFPGSARVRRDPAGELERKIAYLEGLGEQVLELNQGGRSVDEIISAVCGGMMRIELFTLGHYSRRHLVLSYLKMNEEG